MLTFLLLCLMGTVAALVATVVVLPLLLVAGLLRLIFWPFGLILRILGAVVFGPLLGLLAFFGVAIALVVGVVALALPLLPFLLLAGFGWAVYRLSARGSVATPSSGAWKT
jgi:hypothetical protein